MFLGEILGVEEDQLVVLFQRTLELGAMDRFQKSPVWKCYRGILSVRDKLYRRGSAVNRACLRFTLDDETVLQELFQCPNIADLWVYVEYLLSCVRRIRLSTESTVKIVQQTCFNRERKSVFICLVVMTKKVVWWRSLKGLKANTFLFRRSLQVSLEKQNEG